MWDHSGVWARAHMRNWEGAYVCCVSGRTRRSAFNTIQGVQYGCEPYRSESGARADGDRVSVTVVATTIEPRAAAQLLLLLPLQNYHNYYHSYHS